MKMKSIHVRSPQDDEDLSCILIKPELSGNENQTNNPENLDYLLIPTNEQSPHRDSNQSYEKSELLHQQLLQTTNELTSILSQVHSKESQIIILNHTNTMSNTHSAQVVQDMNSESASVTPQAPMLPNTPTNSNPYVFKQGDIVLLNQNTKSKIAERGVLNFFARKYFSTWYRVYKSLRYHRIRMKKLIMREWKKFMMSGKEDCIESIETMIDDLSPPNANLIPGKSIKKNSSSISPNKHSPRVVMIDIASEDLHSLPSQLVLSPKISPISVPTTIDIPSSIHIPHNASSSKSKNHSRLHPPQTNDQQTYHRYGLKESKLKTIKSKSQPSSKRMHSSLDQPTIASKLKTRSQDSISLFSEESFSKQQQPPPALHQYHHHSQQQHNKELRLKYPNLQSIHQYVALYEQQQQHQAQLLLKPPTKVYQPSSEMNTQLLKQKIKSQQTIKHLTTNPPSLPLVVPIAAGRDPPPHNHHQNWTGTAGPEPSDSVSSLSSVSGIKERRATLWNRRRFSSSQTPSSLRRALFSQQQERIEEEEAAAVEEEAEEKLIRGGVLVPAALPTRANNLAVAVVNANAAHPLSDPMIVGATMASPNNHTLPSSTVTNPSSLSSMMHRLRSQSTYSYFDNPQSSPSHHIPQHLSPQSILLYHQQQAEADQGSLCNIEGSRPPGMPLLSSNAPIAAAPAATTPAFGRKLKEKLKRYQPVAVASTPLSPATALTSRRGSLPLNTVTSDDSIADRKMYFHFPVTGTAVAAPSNQQPINLSPLEVESNHIQPIPLLSPQYPLNPLKALKRAMLRFQQFTQQSQRHWLSEQQGDHFYLWSLLRRAFKKLLSLSRTLLSTDVANAATTATSTLRNYRRKSGYNLPPVHLWGEDRLAYRFAVDRWKSFLSRRRWSIEREETVMREIQRRQLFQSLGHWREQVQQQREFRNHLQRKYDQRFLPRENLLVVPQRKKAEAVSSIGRIKNENQTKPLPLSPIPTMGEEISMTLPDSSLIQSFQQPPLPQQQQPIACDSKEEEEDSLSFNLEEEEEEEDSVVEEADKNRVRANSSITNSSIYLSTTTSSSSSSSDSISEEKEEEEREKILSMNDPADSEQSQQQQIVGIAVRDRLESEIVFIPLFARQRLLSFFRYYQSVRYHQYTQKMTVLRLLFVASIQQRLWQRMMMMAERHFKRKVFWRLFARLRGYRSNGENTSYNNSYNDNSHSRSPSLFLPEEEEEEEGYLVEEEDYDSTNHHNPIDEDHTTNNYYTNSNNINNEYYYDGEDMIPSDNLTELSLTLPPFPSSTSSEEEQGLESYDEEEREREETGEGEEDYDTHQIEREESHDDYYSYEEEEEDDDYASYNSDS